MIKLKTFSLSFHHYVCYTKVIRHGQRKIIFNFYCTTTLDILQSWKKKFFFISPLHLLYNDLLASSYIYLLRSLPYYPVENVSKRYPPHKTCKITNFCGVTRFISQMFSLVWSVFKLHNLMQTTDFTVLIMLNDWL